MAGRSLARLAAAGPKQGACRNSFREVAASREYAHLCAFWAGLLASGSSYSPRLPAPVGQWHILQLSSPVTAARLRRIHTVFPWPVFKLGLTSFQRCSNERILQDRPHSVNPPKYPSDPSDPSDQAYCLILSSLVSPVFSGSVMTRRRCQPTSGDITSVISAGRSNSSVRSPESFP